MRPLARHPARRLAALLALAAVLACGAQKVPQGHRAVPATGQPTQSEPALRATPGPPRQAGRPTAAINVEPSMRPWRYVGANPDSWWDPANGQAAADTELALIEELGSPMLRIEFPWYLIEPARGSYDWSRADHVVQAAQAHHVALLPIVVWTPAWAAAQPNQPPRAADFEAFMRSLVTRYRSSIHAWELWNEPNLSRYWSGTDAQYVSAVLTPGYQVVHAVDRSAQVVLGGPSGADVKWLRGVYQWGGADSFDVAAFHDYVPPGQIQRDAGFVVKVLDGQGQGWKPIWLGEYGLEEGPQDTQQQVLMRSVLGTSGPISLAAWYNLRDDYAMTCCPAQIVVRGGWGLVEHDGQTRKAGFATMRDLVAGRSG